MTNEPTRSREVIETERMMCMALVECITDLRLLEAVTSAYLRRRGEQAMRETSLADMAHRYFGKINP